MPEQRVHKKTMAIVLAGGRGTRLKNLTQKRSKPAVFFGGKFRIIDFALSNCLNSGIRRISVVTQYKSHSLLRHLQRGWNFLRPEMNEFIDFLPAQQRIDEESWYRGTADAVYQNLDIIRSQRPEYILILAGDHVYKMDYARVLMDHRRSGAPCSVACIDVPLDEADRYGIMTVGEDHQIQQFDEKPEKPSPMPGRPDRALASMGIYVFNADYLYSELLRDLSDPDSMHDFGRDIIPHIVSQGDARAHFFSDSCVKTAPESEDYWRDVGTIDSYWKANIDLTAITPSLNLYDTDWPIWTYQEQLPPAKFVLDEENRRGVAINSLVSGGCIISGSAVHGSLLFSKCHVNSFCKIEDSVVLPDVRVDPHVRLRKVVVDRGCRLPSGLVVGEDPELDAQRFLRTESGVVLITREMLAELADIGA